MQYRRVEGNMYLSRVKIDYNNRRNLKDLTHVGAYHHWVEQCFPQEISDGERSRKLWRIDRIKGEDYLLVLSDKRPDVRGLLKYGKENTAVIKDYDAYLAGLQEGANMRFRVTLTPVKSVKNTEDFDNSNVKRKRGKVCRLIGVQSQMDFLISRAEKNGFSVDANGFYISSQHYVTLQKTNQKPEKFLKVDYEGVLTITDIDLFRRVLINGLGKKKAYGCGLITVLPVV